MVAAAPAPHRAATAGSLSAAAFLIVSGIAATGALMVGAAPGTPKIIVARTPWSAPSYAATAAHEKNITEG